MDIALLTIIAISLLIDCVVLGILIGGGNR